MINIKKFKNVYEISFPYDKFLVDIIRQVPTRRWNPDVKTWTISVDKLGFFISLLEGTKYENGVNIASDENINKNELIDSIKNIPDIDIDESELIVNSRYKLFQHQIDFVKFAIHRQNSGNLSGFINCDMMGLGKTLENINLAHYNKNHLNYKHCLILCAINISKYNWKNDIEFHSNNEYEGYILGTRYKKNGQLKSTIESKDKLHDLETLTCYGHDQKAIPYFLITNIESIRYKQGKSYPIVDRIIDMIEGGQLSMIIIDEIHKNCSPSSTSGKLLLKIKKKTSSKCQWIPTTGTPIVNTPLDCYVPLKLTDSTTISSFYMWSKQFCIYGGYGGYEIVGYKNIPLLKQMLQANMIRRKKEEVLDLPPKTEISHYIENTEYQNILYKNVVKGILENKEDIILSLNPLSQFFRLRQVNGSPEALDDRLKLDKNYIKYNAKFQHLVILLEEIIANDEKVIVFSNWVHPLRTIYTLLKHRYKMSVFVGTLSEKEREIQKDKFINDPDTKIMLGTIGAMGTAITLTVANNAIFYDCPWTVANYDQACDRIHRISSTKPVTIHKLITKNTVDERADDILFNKKGISEFIVDNIDIHNNPELFDILLSDTKK